VRAVAAAVAAAAVTTGVRVRVGGLTSSVLRPTSSCVR
jgi:hypothetical protein